MLDKLRELNQKLIKKYEKAKDYKNTTTQKVIAQLLKNDECFLKMSIEHSYTILRELGFKEKDYEKIYLELTKKTINN